MKDLSPASRILFLFAAFIVGGGLGIPAGDALGYGIASWLDRDPAEIKGTLLWCFTTVPILSALLTVWLTAVLLNSPMKTGALVLLLALTPTALGLIINSYEPEKLSGIPVIDFELLLPPGFEIADAGSASVTIWNGKDGTGCATTRLDQGVRKKLIGTIVLHPDNFNPTVSIAFRDGDKWLSGGAWEFPYTPGTPREEQPRDWQEVKFISSVHNFPMVLGRFDIRYQLRRFI